MDSLDDDQTYERVKATALQVGQDLIRISDAEFLARYGVSKIEVSINTKVMEALSNCGDISALIRIYFWFDQVLLHGTGTEEKQVMNPVVRKARVKPKQESEKR